MCICFSYAMKNNCLTEYFILSICIIDAIELKYFDIYTSDNYSLELTLKKTYKLLENRRSNTLISKCSQGVSVANLYILRR